MNWMGKYINNTKICVRREIIPFVTINLLSTHINLILLIKVRGEISFSGLGYTLMSGFGTLEMW